MLHGSIVALVTPMDEQGEIDFPALANLVDMHLESGTDALVVAGTTGESATLNAGESQRLLSVVVDQVNGRIPVLAGTGAADTGSTIKNTRAAARLGADAALIVTPYYNRPMQSGLLAHYHAIADATDLPLAIYNVPSRTCGDILPETVAELSARHEIVAIKEAVPSESRVRELVELCGDSLTVLSGDDPTCLRAMQAGARGVVSVAANVVPGRFSAMCRHAAEGNWPAALEIDETLRHLYGILFLETNPIPVKWALHRMALCGPGTRLPLLPLDKKHHEKLDQALQLLGLI
jgi:4-hydroxy-tetrahydrodipicolinate synthase